LGRAVSDFIEITDKEGIEKLKESLKAEVENAVKVANEVVENFKDSHLIEVKQRELKSSIETLKTAVDNINSEIQATLELNEEVFEFDVNKEEFNQTDWDNMRKSISHSDFYNIVNKLSVDGFIEDGDYLLKVY
jgi:hypothetical protein